MSLSYTPYKIKKKYISQPYTVRVSKFFTIHIFWVDAVLTPYTVNKYNFIIIP